jgi:hypothetical protein
MSRSRKKPYLTDQQTNGSDRVRLAKRRANRRVRAADKRAVRGDVTAEVADGKAFRKESCSWDIRDFSIHAPELAKARRK